MVNEEDVTKFLKTSCDLTNKSICEYCQYGCPTPGGYYFCFRKACAHADIDKCNDMRLGKQVKYDRTLVCCLCKHGEKVYNTDYDTYITKCMLDIAPRDCNGKEFKFKERSTE